MEDLVNDEQISRFKKELIATGYFSYSEADTLGSIAERCSVRAGVPLGAALASLGAQAGTITFPGIGTISGTALGGAMGFIIGTGLCTSMTLAMREELKKLVNDQ